jgi:aminoglycoside phosphotransferase (APT) family kinase protein
VERAERTGIYHAMIDTLAALHNIECARAGLGSYGKPGNYFERQVGRWTKQYRGAQTERLDDMEALIDFLPRTLPPQTRTSVVHGDYRIDNMIFDAREPKVLAVLDWELSTTGDPLADFSYLMMNWLTPADARAGLAGLDLPALGIPTLDEAVARYCAATGRDGVPALDWYFAFGLFRLASIVQGIKKRVIDGTASSAHAAEMAERVPFLAARAWDFARKAGA